MALGHELSLTSLVKLVSFLFWSGLYLHTAVSWPHKSPEWISRMITLLHGSVGTIIGLAQCDIVHFTSWQNNMKMSWRHYALMVWSWGYFAFDLLWCLLHQPEGRLVLCHHVSALVAITVYMQKYNTGCTFACNLAMMEVTNPLLQTRWFLKHEGYEKTTLFYVVEVAYVVLFLLVRGVMGTYSIYKIMSSQTFETDEKLLSLVFYFVSIALIYDVMGYVLHRYQSRIGTFLDGMGIIFYIP